MSTTSPTSKSFAGSGASLLAPIALSTPCNRLERATCTSRPDGFATIAAEFPSSSRSTLAKLSSMRAQNPASTSVNPCIAISCRTMSLKWFTGCCAPTVLTGGTVRSMLLYPYAMATSSAMSQGCNTSERVVGNSTLASPPPATFVVELHAAQERRHVLGAMSTPMRPLMYFGSASTNRVMKSGYAFVAHRVHDVHGFHRKLRGGILRTSSRPC